MLAARHLTGRLRRRGGWRLRVLWAMLALLLLAAVVAVVQTRPHRLAGHGSALLEAATGADVRITAARLSSTGRIRLEQVALFLPGDRSDAGRLFEAEEIAIDTDLLALLAGRLHVRSVTFVRPTVYVTEHLATGKFNFQMLPGDETDRGDLPSQLPGLILRGARVRFGEVAEAGYQQTGQLDLAGVLAETQPGAYRFELRRRDRSAATGPTLSGHFDLRAHSYAIDLADFSFAAPESHFLPQRIRAVWQQFSPSGSLPHVRFTSSPEHGRRLTVQLRGGEMTVPVGANPPRVTGVDGDFEITDERVTIQRLTGAFAGIDVTANGHLAAHSPATGPMALTVTTEPFEVPENPPLIADLPEPVQHHYRRFSPSGRFRFAATATRPEAGAPLDLDGTLDLLGVQAAYHGFPYPLKDVTGTIRFSRDAVRVEHLAGRGPTGAAVTVNGTISPPTEGSEVRLAIAATGVALDQHVRNAMEEKHRRILAMFFDEAGYQQLLQRNLVRASASTGALATAGPPVFGLGGVIDIAVDVYRPLGPDKPYIVTNTITTRGVNTLFRFWKYPWRVEQGTLVLGPDAFEVRNLQLAGPTGARATVDGVIDRPDRQSISPRLTVRDAYLPVDELLLHSVPAPQDQWARLAGIRGGVDAEGRIFTDADGRIDWSIDASLAGESAEPFAGGYVIRDLSGHAVLTRDGIALQEIAGTHGDARLGVAGQVDWPTQPTIYDLTFTGEALGIAPDLLGLVPPDLQARETLARLLSEYDARGVADAQLHLKGATDGRAMDYRLRLMPKELAVRYNGGQVQLREMTGAAEVGPELIALESIGGAFETGTFKVGGSILQGEPGRASLNFIAEADRIDATTRAVLPEPVRGVLDELDYRGGYRITEGRLVTRPGAANGRKWDFIAAIELQDAAATLGAPITDLHGRLQISAYQEVGATWPRIDLALDADALEVADRVVTDLDVALNNAAMPDVLMLEHCHGRMYGGEVLATGFVEMGDAGLYSFDLQLVGVDVDSFRDPAAAVEQPTGELDAAFAPPATPSGTFAANLLIEQRRGEPASRRGRGSVSVRDAKLYSQPLPTALMEAINLRLPTTSSFDRASARFDVAGDEVVFDSIRIESPNVAVVGAGTMDWNTHELDLAMFTRNTGGFDLGAISDMFNLLKDELVGVQVRGTLAEPEAKVGALSGLRETLSNADKRPSPPPLAPSR